MAKGTLQITIKLKILRWEDGCGLSVWTQHNPSQGPSKWEAEGLESDGEGHVVKEAEEREVMRYRAVSQGMRKSRSWTKQEMDFPLEPLGENSSVIVDFWALELFRECSYVVLSH